MEPKKILKLVCGLGVLIGVIVLMRVLPFKEWLDPLFTRLEEMGIWGVLLYIGIGILLSLLFVPVSVPITMAGFFFGLWPGFFISMTILAGGTGISAFLGNWIWPKIEDWEIFQRPTFQAVRKVLKEEGLWMVSLLRLTPFLHFMTGNLFLGSLDLKFFPYLGYSLLGMIPGTFLVVMLGDVANSSVFGESGFSLWKVGFFVLGMVAFTFVSWQITRKTRNKLKPDPS